MRGTDRPSQGTGRVPPAPGPLYVLADAEALGPEAVPETVAELAKAGVHWIQIRAKSLRDDDLYTLAEACFRALPSSDPGASPAVALWMNDRPDVAALFPFAGVHLGQKDLSPGEARRVVGSEMWIGVSTHDEDELGRATADPEVDVIAVGPVFATASKANPEPVVGLGFVARARAVTDKTLVAIGGIGPGNLASVLAAGADTAAILGAVCHRNPSEVATRARRLLDIAGHPGASP